MAGKTKLRGYTLVELLIVIGITVLLFSLAIRGMTNSQKTFIFSNAYERVLQIVREARSNAVTGKATLDYTDYDKDALTTTDFATPANYGVDFNPTTGAVTLFADLHKGTDAAQTEGKYDLPICGAPLIFRLGTYCAGKDLAIAQFTVSTQLKVVMAGTAAPAAGSTYQIFFTPIFADVTISPALTATSKFLIFGVSEGTGGRHRCSKIHPISGVPEVATDTECPY